MNRKVIKTSLILVISLLFVWYVLKIFIPEKFVLMVNNPNFIKVGEFIDSHWWLDKLYGIVTSYITYYLYLCAVCAVRKLDLQQNIFVLGAIVLSIVVELIDVNIATYYSIFAMIVLPAIFNAKLTPVAVVFTFHGVCQLLSLSIRGLSTMMLSFNSLAATVMGLEMYFWLILFYILYNYFPLNKIKENNEYGN